MYVSPGSRFDRETVHGEDRYYHLVLLAENNTGYQNLMKIVSKGFVDGFYYKPRIDEEVMREYHEGIIALSAALPVKSRDIWKKDSMRMRRRRQSVIWRSSARAIIFLNFRIMESRCSAR